MKSLLNYIFVFLVTFLAAGSIAYYAIRVFTQSADEIVLPELTGKNIIYVLETLTTMGLNAKLYGTRYDDTIPRYAVLSQDPRSGATIKKGRDVVIYISKGKKENIIPDLRQIPLNQASLLLEKNEFQTGHVAYTYCLKTQKDSIIAQYPEAFATGLKGSLCNLLVSRGPKPMAMVMPEINGMGIEKASILIENQHLGISKITSDLDQNQAYGIVLSQAPGAGSYVTPETSITLVVNGPEKNKTMNPVRLNSLIIVTQSLQPGFLKRHVRVETDILGPTGDLYNEYMAPGEDINILIPLGRKTSVNIFIDQMLIKTIIIDPWKQESNTGDIILWESLPPQFYQPISPGWEKN